MRYFLTLAIGCSTLSAVSAQGFGYPYNPNLIPYVTPFAPPGQYLQNYFNRGTQPLSPYLNLLRGTNDPGINYYYGVRPGLPTGGMPFQQYGAAYGSSPANTLNRMTYLPQAGVSTPDPQPLPTAGMEVVLPPSGHSVTYGNFFGQSRTGVPASGTGSRGNFFTPPTTGTVKKGTNTK